MITETCFPVANSEVDGMGIVHHSIYPLWFEKGRKDFFKNAGFSSLHFANKGFYLPLVQLITNFKYPARNGNEIVVLTKIHSMTCVKIHFEYVVLDKAKAKTLAAGKTVHVWTNQKVEPVNIQKEAPDIYHRLKHFSEAVNNTANIQ